MTDIEKIREYLVGMANAACCNKQTAKDIKEIIIPHIDSLQKEPVSEDLEEATNNYCLNARKGYPRVKDETDRYICSAFKAGAQWQKEQIVKEAIGGIARPDNSEIWCNLSSFNLKDGDKVRVVVIKED